MIELVNELTSKLGIQEGQAKGGAGLIFKLAQQKLGGDFSKIASVVPGVNDMMSSAPPSEGGSKVTSGILGALSGESKGQSLGDFAGLAGGFSKLNLSGGIVTKFIQIILNYVKGKGGNDTSSLLSNALQNQK